jgi:hypothetical protein
VFFTVLTKAIPVDFLSSKSGVTCDSLPHEIKMNIPNKIRAQKNLDHISIKRKKGHLSNDL